MFNEKNRVNFCHDAIARLKERIYTKIGDLQMTAYRTKEPVSWAQRETGERQEVAVGDSWGDLFDCAWFHMQGQLPANAQGKKVVLVLDINGEGLVYDEQGQPFRAITNINSDFDRTYGLPGKRIVPFREVAAGGETVDLWMDAGCNDLFGNWREEGRLKEAYIAVCDEEVRRLYYDLEVLDRLLQITPPSEPRRYELLDRLFRAVSCLSTCSAEELRSAHACIDDFYKQDTGYQSLCLTATGHAHLDLAWLWPLRETRRKAARTFATALDLMERYPDYLFGASQPQCYAWIREDHPAMFERIRARIAEGRWEPQGAMWVESDTNLTGAESLVRQFLYGNRFWEKEYGKYVDFMWLPDVFGYTASLPQIIRGFGISYFSTIKLSWNEHNRFPYSTFHWKGLDGSSVLVHMPPEGCYLSEASPRGIRDCAARLAESSQYGMALLPFGIGDGGGGPSPYHLEFLQREKHLPGLPPVEQGTIHDFFHRLDRDAERFPSWQGELYLEKHQGTYTTAAHNKRHNRQMECLLRDTEFLQAMAMRLLGASYPGEELERIWKEVLLYQFHDILPGSSIDRVYRETEEHYAALEAETNALRQQAAQALAARVDTAGMSRPQVLFNTLSFPRKVTLPTDTGTYSVELPPMGYAAVDLAAGAPAASASCDAATRCMENDRLRVIFAEDGRLLSLYDKRMDRETLAGPSNAFLLYTETGDAWDFSADYRQLPIVQATCESMEMGMEGTAAVCRQTYRYARSSWQATITLEGDSPLLRVDCQVDWQKDNVMLRVQFLPAVRFQTVDCDIQFGHITRNALSNTSEDLAQFEMAAHKWIEVDEAAAGFALLNDCKYGYYVKDGVVEMNCLRSTFHPGKEVDRGTHSFSYALLPTAGRHERLETIRQAYAFNIPAIRVDTDAHAGDMPRALSLLAPIDDRVIIETVKKAEDSDGIIVRSYEALGGEAVAGLRCAFPCEKTVACDLYERPLAQAPAAYTPFAIRTLALLPS